jgi:hypothetical protein
MRSEIRAGLAHVCFALGNVWAVAGACRLIFGIKITLPILPPLGLEGVHGWWALAVSLGLFTAAAWLGRGDAIAHRHDIPNDEQGHPTWAAGPSRPGALLAGRMPECAPGEPGAMRPELKHVQAHRRG